MVAKRTFEGGCFSMETKTPKTISVPEAGKRYFDLAKNAAYAAAKSGELPVIRIGGRLRVPVCQLEQMLQGSQPPDRGDDDVGHTK